MRSTVAITSRSAAITAAGKWTISFGPPGSATPSGVDAHYGIADAGLRGTLKMNQSGNLAVAYSPDGSTWHTPESAQTWSANTETAFSVDTRWGSYCRLTFTPDADTSSAARVYVYLVSDAAGL